MVTLTSASSGLGVVALVSTTIHGVSRAQAELARRVVGHFVEGIGNFIGLRHEGPGVALADFAEAHRRMATAGYDPEPIDAAWAAFEQTRAACSGRLEALAEYWAVPAARWVEEHAATGATGATVHGLPAAAHHHDEAGRIGTDAAEAQPAAGLRDGRGTDQ